MKKKAQSKELTPERVIHNAAVAAGYIPDRALRDTIDTLLADGNLIPAKLRRLSKKFQNPFLKIKSPTLSKKSLRELDRIRSKISKLPKAKPRVSKKPLTLPVDPRQIAENDGMFVISSSGFGSEFQCLIEYNKPLRRFILIHRVNSSGKLDPATRLAIARHIGHYAHYEDDLKSGAVVDTTHLDAGEEERAKAAEMAIELLVPTDVLQKHLSNLALIYDVAPEILVYQVRYGAPDSLPASINPAKPGANSGF